MTENDGKNNMWIHAIQNWRKSVVGIEIPESTTGKQEISTKTRRSLQDYGSFEYT
jgi:hypothetical protein